MLPWMVERSINHSAVCEEQKTQPQLNNKKSSAIIMRRRSSFLVDLASEGVISDPIFVGYSTLPSFYYCTLSKFESGLTLSTVKSSSSGSMASILSRGRVKLKVLP